MAFGKKVLNSTYSKTVKKEFYVILIHIVYVDLSICACSKTVSPVTTFIKI